MKEFLIVTGTGRTSVTLEAVPFGTGLIVKIFNENAHLAPSPLGNTIRFSKGLPFYLPAGHRTMPSPGKPLMISAKPCYFGVCHRRRPPG